MLGVEALTQYLRRAEGKLARYLLSHCRIVTVPCINRVGMLCCERRLISPTDSMACWGVRSCPTPGVHVPWGEGRVWCVPLSHKGSESPPGWCDPNRGWEAN